MSQPYFPIDELFIELLCSIFELCCEVEILETRPLDEKIEDKIDVIQRCSPLTLVHVSQRWRTAGLQLRPIWSFIRVKDNTPLSKIRFWLDRSGNHPLSIVIDEVDPYRLLDAYNLLVPHAERWAEFRILAGESSIGDYPDRNWRLVPLLKRTNEQDSEPLLSAPILTVLHLQRRISMLLLIDRTMSYPSFHSAVLQKLTVVRINFEWSHLAFYGTLSGITELEVDQSFRTL
ncbi:hypothetical protein FRC03_012187 [Tulasnella sp. 419]|nr:hypothetical protein FRC02_003130 [Tulasnella sp. 418]KAG8952287.1 hypothetical protein FRC03_012187 [Tulasnella sp. 419]